MDRQINFENLHQVIDRQAEFDGKLPHERKAILRKHLVYPEAIMVENELRGHVGEECEMELGDAEEQFRTEAWELFYDENTFNVPLERLDKFLRIPLLTHEGVGIPIGPLVGLIVVDYLMPENLVDDLEDALEDEKSRLKDLLRFTNARQVTLRLVGRKTLDGMDLVTHTVINRFGGVVEELIQAFGLRFDIKKCLLMRKDEARSIKSYWLEPTDETKERVHEGIGSFEDVMQVEINDWLWDIRNPVPVRKKPCARKRRRNENGGPEESV
ncbi:hypothetical protein NM208_g5946 [Fusarium decemcellulare]|uniref:Uncharacterized protein n=1 Tax=Fusarium decemcellulare TaxID=57161 RepID=A0ACC1SEZ2_9HYPO|nr:hypothetical protein NM208_g5946 [Fusarium decemcellulare]